MTRHPLTRQARALLAAPALIAALAAPGAAAQAAARPLPKLAPKATLDGVNLQIRWAKTTAARRVGFEVRVRATTTAAKDKHMRDRVQSGTIRGATGVTTVTLKRTPTGVKPSAVRVRLRVCTSAKGKARRCGSWSAFRHPVAGTIGGTAVASPGTLVTPTPASTTGPTIGSCPSLPASAAMNEDVSALPVDPRSDAYVRSIGSGSYTHPDFGRDVGDGSGPIGFGIPYRVVPASQPLVPTTFTDYADESDPGPYPVPLDTPVEGGPSSDGDRHVLVVQEAAPGGDCKLYEMGNAYPKGDHWEASGGAVWDLTTGAPRPAGWTSADAAGLPILPGLVRYDEVAAGVIRHAIRFTVPRTQKAYIAPASHWASSDTDQDLPPMGLRMRLKASYDISGFHGQALVVATALKRYGMIVADNGSSWYLSGAPDTRWDDDDLGQLKGIPGTAYEAVQTGDVVRP